MYKFQIPKFQTYRFWSLIIWSLIIIWNLVLGIWNLNYLYAQEQEEEEEKEKPMVLDADKFEFSTDKKEVIATGNVVVISKDTKLTCQKLILNNQTKDCLAQGNARLDDKSGVIEGTKITYNFANKSGVIVDTEFRANPYFGRADKTQKFGEEKFINYWGYMTTCDYDNPHWRMKSRRMTILPGDKIQVKDSIFYAGQLPFMYLPQFNRSLKDPLMHVQFMAGKTKEWGIYYLSAWRYNLTEDISGRIYLDLRGYLGLAEGFGVTYTSEGFGKGDFKYYYTQERNKTKEFSAIDVNLPKVFQRYLVRLRHQWDMDEQTKATVEYYKIVDSKRVLYPSHEPSFGFLKEYFYREYEKDARPISYIAVHHAFNYSNLDFLLEKRVNRWYDETEKLPQIDYSLPSFQIGKTPFYFNHSSQLANYIHKLPVPASSTTDKRSRRIDTANKLSLLTKAAFVSIEPFVQYRGTYYNRDVYGSATVLRSIFYSGANASTKFYRIFNIKTNFLRLDLNDLRHVITPTIGYSYNNQPTVPPSKLQQIDGTDSLSGRSNSASLGLSNILQTKRNNQAVSIVDFLVSNSYNFKTQGQKSQLGDFLFKLGIFPYSWMAINLDATYTRTGDPSAQNFKTFSNVSYNIDFNFREERTIGFNHRYQRKGPNEFVYNAKWRLNPKWKFSLYHRIITGHRDLRIKKGLREQEYFISRDLHCWTIDLTYNTTRDKGESILFIFRLKAFPELAFDYNQEYRKPKPGELSY